MHRESNVIFYEFILVAVAAASAGALIWFSVSDSGNIWAIWAAGCICTAALLGFILIVADPNRVRAHNTDKLLTLASQMLEVVSQGRVRRSRLYYLRALKGKAARIKPRGRF